jgi:hypothetical protein
MPTIADKFGKASIDTNYAIATTVKTTRNPGVAVLEAFDLSKFADATPVFVVTYKKTTDPVTNITSVTNLISWKALVNVGANTLTNLTLAPGYADTGNAIGDFIECIPTSYWVNSMMDGLFVGHNPVVRDAELMFDHVASGAVLTGLGYGTNLNVSLTSGICYINGNRQIIPAVASRAYTFSKDTYVDALYNASGTATLVYTEVVNNAASPALAANSVRLGIVCTGATSVPAATYINQGEDTALFPTSHSGTVWVITTDTLGNLICPRDPNRLTLGYRRVNVTNQTSSASWVQIQGLIMPIKVPTRRKVKVTVYSPFLYNNTGSARADLGVLEGSIAGTLIAVAHSTQALGTGADNGQADRTYTPATNDVTYYGALKAGGGGVSFADKDTPVDLYIRAELV